MADLEFKLPDIGEGVHEGEIVAWHVAPGDRVGEDDPLLEVMTDKATVTIGAPQAATVKELRFAVGDVAHVGEVLLVLQTGAGAAASGGASTAKAKVARGRAARSKPPGARSSDRAATAVGDIRAHLPGTEAYPIKRDTGRVKEPLPAEAREHFDPKPLATPATRRLARELGVDLRRVRPTRPDRRITNDDVRRHAGAGAGAEAEREVAVAQGAEAPPPEGSRDQRRPFVGVRRQIARHLQRSVQTAAHFTFVEECEVDRLVALRDRLAPQADERGVKLTLLPFVIKAVVEALRHHPLLNSYLDEEAGQIVLRGDYHIGIATATEQGLLVPVLRNADHHSILEIAREVDRLAEGAREGTLGRDELTGSTFTVTSLGKHGGLFATPILNHPEVGILGVHRMRERPVVRDGQIAIGKVMLLSLSFDHRVVDGYEGAAFAYDVIGYLQEPDRLILEMA